MMSFMGNKQKTDFKGFDDWIEIFKAGTQTDSKGRTRTFTQADLDQVVANHDPDHPAPHVVTHNESYSPFAFGQAAELRRVGDVLQVKSQKVNPDFEKLVEIGALYERSVRLRPTANGFKLGHIAWLGAEAPAVQGLAPIQFEQGTDCFDYMLDTYTPGVLARTLRSLRDFLIEQFSLEQADDLVPDYVIEGLNDHVSNLRNSDDDAAMFSRSSTTTTEGDMPFTQDDIDAAVAQGKEQGKAEAESDFSSAENDLKTELDAERRKNRTADYQALVDKAVDAGQLTPAQAEGMVDFMLALPADSFEFSVGEGDKATTTKVGAVAWFQDFVGSLGKQADLSESDEFGEKKTFASDFNGPAGEHVDAERLSTHNKAQEYMRTHDGVDYIQAVQLVEHQAIGYDGNVATAAATMQGLAQTDAASGEQVAVDVQGTGIAIAGAAIAVGADLEVGAAGKLVTKAAGVSVGRALQAAGADGDLIEIMLLPK